MAIAKPHSTPYPTSPSQTRPTSSNNNPQLSSSNTQIFTATFSPSSPALVRLVLKLTLITLHETDSFHHTERIQKRREDLKKIEMIVSEHLEGGKEAASHYSQEKVRLWTTELGSAEKVFTGNIRRLRELFERSLLPYVETSTGRVMYILVFLFHAMKVSYETKGVGAELILSLFRDILKGCQQKVFERWHPDFEQMDTEELVKQFMTHLTFPENEMPTMVNFDLLLQRAIDDEVAREFKQLRFLEEKQNEERTRIEKEMIDEQDGFSKSETAISNLYLSHKREEESRRERIARNDLQKPRMLSRMWRRMYRDMSHERGPWSSNRNNNIINSNNNNNNNNNISNNTINVNSFNTFSNASKFSLATLYTPTSPPIYNTQDIIYWLLDPTENSSRMRKLQKRNYQPNLHVGCVKRTGSTSNLHHNINAAENTNLVVSVKLKVQNDPLAEPLTKEDSNNNNSNSTPPNTPNAPILHNSNTPLSPSETPPPEILPSGDKLLFQTQGDFIKPMSVTPGRIEVTPTHLYFIAEKGNNDHEDESLHHSQNASLFTLTKRKDRRWEWSEVKTIHMRSFLLRPSAIELFLYRSTSILFNFPSSSVREKFYKKITSLRLIEMIDEPYSLRLGNIPTPFDVFKRTSKAITRRWKRREISNFDYLMYLNTMAGRSYNDLSQYPVFPWVIADYTSPVLDLTKPSTFRDLTKPIGALNPHRLQDFIDRYEAFEDPVIPKFLYGSHYSSVGTVLYYLIRLEPFTSHFLHFQGGKFDHPERMFLSIQKCWENCLSNQADVKELIPEFFYLPELFSNHNGVDFGFGGNGDVILPPWASTPEIFVRKNREALESEYVSANLHHWIDLIFGFKQRGKAAIEARNVFYYLTYEGVVDMESIEDPVDRKSIESQIFNFGQTPSLLLQTPHPPRKTLEEIKTKKMKWYKFPSITASLNTSLPQHLPYNYTINTSSPVPYIVLCPLNSETPQNQQVVMINVEGVIGISNLIGTPDAHGLPFTFEMDKTLASSGPKVVKKVEQMIYDKLTIIKNCFGVLPDGRHIVSCGDLDGSFQITSVSTGKCVRRISKHRDIVTCLAVGSDGTIVTGSFDHTVLIWNSVSMGITKGQHTTLNTNDSPIHTLYGHDDIITCVAVSSYYGIVVSGSRDMTCIVHKINGGRYIRTLQHDAPLSLVNISKEGDIVVYSRDSGSLQLFTINGNTLGGATYSVPLQEVIFSSNGKYLITGSSIASHESIIVRSTLPGIEICHVFECDVGIRSMTLACEDRFLMVGLLDGRINMFEFQPDKWLQHQT